MCVCVRFGIWATTTMMLELDASMILTFEHYNNHVVRMMLPLFVHVSSLSVYVVVYMRLCMCEC